MIRISHLLKNELFSLILIVLIGAFLRFWRLDSRQYLTYDQSRDYLILKKMIVDRKFTLVGPTVSIAPGFFLPPFYYYSLIPFFWLFNFRPLGPDVYTALLGTISIIIFYFLGRDYFKCRAVLVATLMFAVNPYLIHASRHAWNPNTMTLFIMLFAFSFGRYVLKNQRNYLILASFSLSWAIGLHLTAVVFLPLLIYLFFLEFRKKTFGSAGIFSIMSFVCIFLPLVFFDFRHNFPVSKAAISFLHNQTSGGSSVVFFAKFKEFVFDMVKMPAVLLSGLFQKENLTIRPSNITVFGKVNIFSLNKALEVFRLFLPLFLYLFAVAVFLLSSRKDQKIVIIFSFLTLGFFIRFLFPVDCFYFYYYLSVFPFVFLVIAFSLEKFDKKLFLRKLLYSAVIILSFLPILSERIHFDARNEKYFLPASEIISEDIIHGQKIAIASNVGDRTRWEKNGLEYRYFLETRYGFNLGGWESNDYRNADVLYLVDEGDLPDPLEFKGMEMEAFNPKKIEKVWQVETGQKVYKMTH